MSTNVGAVDFELLLNSNPFNKGLKNASTQVRSSGIGNSLKGIGKIAAAAFSVAAITKFGKECIKLGSDLAEVQNVVDVTFGNLNTEVNNFAQNAIEQFGLGQTVTKKYVGTFGAMAKAFNFSNEEALQMSKTLTGLAGDVASFYNLSSDEAYTKLKSVFTGETETLKDLGVVMTQNALDQYALANGYGKTTSAMTEQEKVALRYKFVLDKLSLANGDFARTSDSWANQTRVLSLRFNELKATLGQGFINLFTPIVKGINVVLGKLQVLANAFKSFTEMIFGNAGDKGAGSFSNVAAEATGASEAISGIGESAKKAGKDAKKASSNLADFDSLNVRQQDTDSSSGGSGGGGSGIDMAGLGDFSSSALGQVNTGMDSLIEKAKLFFVPFQNAWANFGQPLIDSAKKAGQSIFEILKSIGKSFAEVWTNGTGEATVSSILRILTSVFNIIGNISNAFKNAWETDNKGTQIIQSLWNGFNNLLGIIEGVHKAYEEWTASESFQTFANAITSICQTLSGWFEKITQKLKEIWENGGKEAFGKLLEFITKVAEAVDATFTVLEPIISTIVEVVGDAINAITTSMGDVLEGLGGLMDFITGVFTGDWDKAWDGIKTFCESIWNSLLDLVSGIGQMLWDSIVGFLDGIKSSWDSMWQWLFDLASNIWNGLLDKIDEIFPGMKNTILNIVSSIANWIRDKFNFIKDTVSNIFNGVKNTAINIWNSIKNSISTAVNNIKNGITTAFQTAYNKVTSIFSKIGSFFSGIWNTVKNTFSKLGTSIGSAISNAVKSGINGVISMIQNTINKAINLINGAIGIINNIPGVNIGKLRTLSFPRLAEGGYVKANTPQLAMIGDNKHQGEVVAPEDKLLDSNLKALKMFFDQYMAQRDTGSNQEITIVLQFAGELAQLARILKPELDAEAKRKGFKLVVEGGTT